MKPYSKPTVREVLPRDVRELPAAIRKRWYKWEALEGSRLYRMPDYSMPTGVAGGVAKASRCPTEDDQWRMLFESNLLPSFSSRRRR